MILYFKITKEQKQALLSRYPDIKSLVERTIENIADKIIFGNEQFNVEEELKQYHDRRELNGNNIHGRKCTQETRDKIIKTLKGKYIGWHPFPETIEKLKGHIVSKETRDLISKKNKGKKRTEKQSKNIGLGHKGMKYKKHVKVKLN